MCLVCHDTFGKSLKNDQRHVKIGVLNSGEIRKQKALMKVMSKAKILLFVQQFFKVEIFPWNLATAEDGIVDWLCCLVYLCTCHTVSIKIFDISNKDV